MSNKVKFGLKNVYYATITSISTTGAPIYSTPSAWPGAVNMSLEAQGELTKFRADNTDYWIGNGNDGYEGDFESALVPDSFKTDVLGYIVDNNNILVEDADATPKEFALLFEIDGDDEATRHVLYRCSATRPAVASQTTEAQKSPVTETVSITALGAYNAALEKNLIKARAVKTDSAYSSWFSSVYVSTGAGS